MKQEQSDNNVIAYQPEQYNNYVIAYYDGSLTQTLVASTDPFTAMKDFLEANDFDLLFYNSLNLEDLLDQINIDEDDQCISIMYVGVNKGC